MGRKNVEQLELCDLRPNRTFDHLKKCERDKEGQDPDSDSQCNLSVLGLYLNGGKAIYKFALITKKLTQRKIACPRSAFCNNQRNALIQIFAS